MPAHVVERQGHHAALRDHGYRAAAAAAAATVGGTYGRAMAPLGGAMALSSVARDDGRRQRRGPADFACTAPTDNDEANAPAVVALRLQAAASELL